MNQKIHQDAKDLKLKQEQRSVIVDYKKYNDIVNKEVIRILFQGCQGSFEREELQEERLFWFWFKEKARCR